MTVIGRSVKAGDPCPHGATLSTCAESWCKSRMADLRERPAKAIEAPETASDAIAEIRATRQMRSWRDLLADVLPEIPVRAVPGLKDGKPDWAGTAGSGTCQCGQWWRGEKTCHCATCHLTFTSEGPFDVHRTGPMNNRRCLTEAELREKGYEPNEHGRWRKPAPEGTFQGRKHDGPQP